MAKCEVISEAKAFKPVTLQVTLESQDEVNALYFIMSDMNSNGFKRSGLDSVVRTFLENVRGYVR